MVVVSLWGIPFLDSLGRLGLGFRLYLAVGGAVCYGEH